MEIKHPNRDKARTRQNEWTDPKPLPDTIEENIETEVGPDLPNSEFSDKRRKKDKRKWCKGKVGREHNLAIRAESYLENMGATCGYKPYQIIGNDETKYHWSCIHEEYCTNCGKILASWLPEEKCPTLDSDSKHNESK